MVAGCLFCSGCTRRWVVRAAREVVLWRCCSASLDRRRLRGRAVRPGRLRRRTALRPRRRRLRHEPASRVTARRRLTSALSSLAVKELDQSRFRTEKALPLFTGKGSQNVDQYSLPRNLHHVAGVDPATGTPGESDAALEQGGLRRMEAVLVRADGRSAGSTDPSIAVGNRPPGADLSPALLPRDCSSSRHEEQSLTAGRRLSSGTGSPGPAVEEAYSE